MKGLIQSERITTYSSRLRQDYQWWLIRPTLSELRLSPLAFNTMTQIWPSLWNWFSGQLTKTTGPGKCSERERRLLDLGWVGVALCATFTIWILKCKFKAPQLWRKHTRNSKFNKPACWVGVEGEISKSEPLCPWWGLPFTVGTDTFLEWSLLLFPWICIQCFKLAHMYK